MDDSFITITLRSTLTRYGCTCLGPSMGQTELLNHLLRIIISYLEPYSYVQIIYVI